MWMIFVGSAVVIALVIAVVAWIIHRIVNSMIREDRKLAKELEEKEKE